jgi:osmotically-inducible protein OsmY
MKNFLLIPIALTMLCLNSRASEAPNSSPDDRESDQELVLNPIFTSYHEMRINREIRKTLLREKGLSESARNIDIIANEGHVTLIGAVQSKAEIHRILRAVRHINGISTLTSELTVRDKNDTSAVDQAEDPNTTRGGPNVQY